MRTCVHNDWRWKRQGQIEMATGESFSSQGICRNFPSPPLILPRIFCWLDFKRRRRVDEATTSSLSNIVNPHLTAGFVKLFVYDPILLICCNFILKRLWGRYIRVEIWVISTHYNRCVLNLGKNSPNFYTLPQAYVIIKRILSDIGEEEELMLENEIRRDSYIGFKNHFLNLWFSILFFSKLQ